VNAPHRSRLGRVVSVLMVVGTVVLVESLVPTLLVWATSQPVAAGQTYPWSSSGEAFVQPTRGGTAPSCLVRSDGVVRSQIAFDRPAYFLTPGGVVRQRGGESSTITCDQPIRITTGFVATLYLGSIPSIFEPAAAAALIILGATIWIVRRRNRTPTGDRAG
jgi:hypothetical protein